MKSSLLWRFALPVFLIFSVAALFLSLFFSISYKKNFQLDIQNNLASLAHFMAEEIKLPVEDASVDPYKPIVTRFANGFGLRVTIIAQDGTVLADSDSDPQKMDNHLSRPEVQEALQDGLGSETRYSKTLRSDLIYVAIKGESASGQPIFIRLSKPLTVVGERIKQVQRTILLSYLIVSALLFISTMLVTRRTIKPILDLTEATKKIAVGNFETIPLSKSTDETGLLTNAFSNMALQVQSQLDELAKERHKNFSVIQNLVDALIVVDPTGNVILVNPAAERLFDISQTDVSGRTLAQSVKYYQIVDLWQKTVDTAKPQTIIIDLKAEQKYYHGVSILFEGADPGTVLLLFQDLSRQRNLERIRQDFVSNVSHELRTPLASLKALTETLQESAIEDTDTARHFLGRMDVEIEKLNQMVMELLDLSRIESGRVPMQKEYVHVCDLLSAPVERMKMQAERAGINLFTSCQDDLPLVNLDSGRIEQVLVNLIHNSIKFTQPGGEIIVSAKAEPGSIIIQVKDNGCGIPEKNIPRIFERFYKVDKSRSMGGTGLGLSITKHVIEAHGGKVWVESKENEGTVVSFSIPFI